MQSLIANRIVYLFPFLNVIQVPNQEHLQILLFNYCTFSVRCLKLQKAEFRLTTREMRREMKWVISQGDKHSPSKALDTLKSIPPTIGQVVTTQTNKTYYTVQLALSRANTIFLCHQLSSTPKKKNNPLLGELKTTKI